jgi:hypothetical protein
VLRLVSGPEVVLAATSAARRPPCCPDMLPGVLVKDSGIAGPDVRVLRWVTAGRPTVDPTRERAATPLTEQSPLFGGTDD